MKRTHFVVAGISTILSIFYLVAALHYPMGTARKPGPGLYPLMVACFLLASSIITCLQARAGETREKTDWPRGGGRRRIAAILVALLAYILMLPVIGHPIAATIVAFIALQALEEFRLPMRIGLAVLLGLGSFYLFHNLLGVPLPGGPWFK
jgi:hypothetical protein